MSPVPASHLVVGALGLKICYCTWLHMGSGDSNSSLSHRPSPSYSFYLFIFGKSGLFSFLFKEFILVEGRDRRAVHCVLVEVRGQVVRVRSLRPSQEPWGEGFELRVSFYGPAGLEYYGMFHFSFPGSGMTGGRH